MAAISQAKYIPPRAVRELNIEYTSKDEAINMGPLNRKKSNRESAAATVMHLRPIFWGALNRSEQISFGDLMLPANPSTTANLRPYQVAVPPRLYMKEPEYLLQIWGLPPGLELEQLDEPCLEALCTHPEVLRLILRNRTCINWVGFSRNPAAVTLIESRLKDAHPDSLCLNENAGHLVKANLKRVNWNSISMNKGRWVPRLIAEHPEKVNWRLASSNPVLGPLLMRNLRLLDWDAVCANEGAGPLIEFPHSRQFLNISVLCTNPCAGAIRVITKVLEETPELICWPNLSTNRGAIHLLMAHLDKIDRKLFCYNTAAVPFLRKNQDWIRWSVLALNEAAMDLLDANLDRIRDNPKSMRRLCSNRSLLRITGYNWQAIRDHNREMR